MKNSPVSKAIAGALVSVIASLLLKYNVNLGPEFSGALEVVLDTIVAAAIGFGGVYMAPRNKETK